VSFSTFKQCVWFAVCDDSRWVLSGLLSYWLLVLFRCSIGAVLVWRYLLANVTSVLRVLKFVVVVLLLLLLLYAIVYWLQVVLTAVL